MRASFLVTLVFSVLGLSSQALAHGGVSLDQGQCIMKIGPDTMTFTGYQPQKSREQFCDDIPDIGPTIIVLDAQQNELRDMAIDMRLLSITVAILGEHALLGLDGLFAKATKR